MNKDPILAWYESLPVDEFEELKIDFAVALDKALNSSGKSRTELAKIVEVSPARITKILCGDSNLTLAVMYKLATALGKRVHIHLAPIGSQSHVFHCVSGQNETFNSDTRQPLSTTSTIPNKKYFPYREAA